METYTLAVPELPDEERKKQQLEQMKFRAGALLVGAAVLFVVASLFEDRAVWIGYVRAAAEAGMVGGVADWFAVTALFRHPLNLPIPHTAIVPARKDKIGRSLGNFVQNNFLSPAVLVPKLRSIGIAERLAEWLSRPENGRIMAKHASAALSGAVQVLRDDEVQTAIDQSLARKVRATPVAPVLGHVLSLVTTDGRHQELLDSVIRLLDRLIDENREELRERITREIPWWVPTPVDEKIYQKIIAGVENTLHEISVNPEHPLRARYHDAVFEFIEKLQESPELIARGEAVKEEVLAHPAVRAYSASLWGDIKASLLKYSADPESQFHRQIERAVTNFGESLQQDAELREKIEGWAESAALYVVEQYRHEVGDLIATTVAAWDAEDTSRKIELQIGRDLQFIRINGTLVGGLVGVLIHVLKHWL